MTDDQSRIQSAVDAGYQTIDGEGLTYRVDSLITLPTTKLVIRNATFDWSNSTEVRLFRQDGSVDTAHSLTANSGEGSDDIDIADASSFAVYDYVWLRSDRIWSEAGSVQVDVSDIHQIESISSNTLTTYGRFNSDFDTADNATVEKITFAEGVEFERCTFIGSNAGTYNHQVYRGTYVRGFVARDCDVRNFHARAFLFETCIHCMVDNCRANGFNPGAGGGNGNLVAVNTGSQWMTLTNSFSNNGSGIFDTGGTRVNRYLTVTDNYIESGEDDAGINTHPSCDQILIRGNRVRVNDSTADGIICQGNNAIISDNIVEGLFRHGIFCQYMGTGLDHSSTGDFTIVNNKVRGRGQDALKFNLDTVNATGGDVRSLVINGNTVQSTTSTWDNALAIRCLSGDLRCCVITGNSLSGFSEDGIRLQADTTYIIENIVISGNRIDGSSADNGILLTGADSNSIQDGYVHGGVIADCTTGINLTNGNNGLDIYLGQCIGVTTNATSNTLSRNSGTGSIASGSTSDVITHNLIRAPNASQIHLALTENPTNDPGNIWISSIGATTFTVNCRNDPGASDLDFSWSADTGMTLE